MKRIDSKEEKMSEETKEKNVYSVTNKILREFQLDDGLKRSSNKAILAKLRNSIGREISYSVDICQYIFSRIPYDFLGKTKKMTEEENAIFVALQLYSLHQQGKEVNVHFSSKDHENIKEIRGYRSYNLGDSLSAIRVENESTAMDRRFNFMILSSTIDELKIHLRSLIGIFKSKSDDKIDYAKLAKDLYCFQKGNEEEIRLSWARSYYSNKKQEVRDGK